MFGSRAARLEQRALDRGAGLVLDVEHARAPMCAPSSVQWKSGAVSVERNRELLDQQLLDEVRALAREQRDGLGRAETVARALDVGGQLSGVSPGGRATMPPCA